MAFFIALFVVVLSGCVMGLGLLVTADFLEASATRRKLDEKDRALCPANASGRRRDNEMGSGSAHAGGRLGKLTEH